MKRTKRKKSAPVTLPDIEQVAQPDACNIVHLNEPGTSLHVLTVNGDVTIQLLGDTVQVIRRRGDTQNAVFLTLEG